MLKKVSLFVLIFASLFLIRFSYADEIVRIKYNNLNFRKTPSSKVLLKLKKNQEFKLIAKETHENGVWYKIKVGDKLGFIHSFYAELKKSRKEKLKINTEVLNVRDKPWGKILTTVKKGEVYDIISKVKDNKNTTWYRITKGYISGDYVLLLKDEKRKIRVNYNNLNLRESPRGKILGKVNRGDIFILLGESRDSKNHLWYKIKKGYIAANYASVVSVDENPIIKVEGKSLVVKYNGLLVREKPHGKIITRVNKDEHYKIYAKKRDSYNHTWYKIKKGYVAGGYTTVYNTKERNHDIVINRNLKKIIVKYEASNIREKPWGKVIAKAQAKEVFDVLSERIDARGMKWYRVSRGYIASSVSEMLKDYNIRLLTATHIKNANFYTRPNGRFKMKVKSRRIVELLTDLNAYWAKVKYNGQIGYIKKKELSFIGAKLPRKINKNNKKLIAIDAGHTILSSGRRTYKLDGVKTHFGDGRIREAEFNFPMSYKLKEALERNGFKVVLVSEEEKSGKAYGVEGSLIRRVTIANENKADLYISIHYDALGNYGWRSSGGIKVFADLKNTRSNKIARLTEKNIKNAIRNFKIKTRGVYQEEDFFVLNNTNMPSILVEHGFMDVKYEALLMLNQNYIKAMAEAEAKAICEYFNVIYRD